MISKRAQIDGSIIAKEAFILGPSIIKKNSLIGNMVIIGFPSRISILKVLARAKNLVYWKLLDKASKGSYIDSNCIIRPGTVIYEETRIGSNVEIGHNVLIRERTRIEDNTLIGSYTVIDGKSYIGKKVKIETGVYIPPDTLIEDEVFIGPYVVLTNDRFPPSKKLKGVKICKGAVIGANSIVIAGIIIGKRAIVGAGSVVVKDVPDEKVVAGIPAKPLYSRQEFEKRKKEWEK